MVPATDYRCMLPAFGVSLRQVAARFVALAPQLAWGGRLRPWGRCPLISPEDFTPPSPPTEREHTHKIEKRDRRTHHITHHATLTQHDTTPLPANPANLANTKTWYGEGIERVRSGSISHLSGFFLDER